MTLAAAPVALHGHRHRVARRASMIIARRSAAVLGGVVAFDLLVLARDVWAARLVALAVLVVVPGVLLLAALAVPASTLRRNPLLVPASSLVILMATGLLTDIVGLGIGADAPLRTMPLTGALDAVVILLAVPAMRGWTVTLDGLASLVPRARTFAPLLLPAAAVVGVLRLNSGHGADFARVVAVAAVLVLVGGGLVASRLSGATIGVLLYAVALAAMLSFSLRGYHVYGFDVSSELRTANDTVATGAWHADHSDNAYGAMLSLTVLPALLHALTGVPAWAALSALFPALFALFPVAVYQFARRFLSRRAAYLSAAFTTVQAYFFHQLPEVARQEIGLLLFAALLGLLFETGWSRSRRGVLVCTLSLGLVVAHYSTVYVTVGMLLIAVVLQALIGPRLGANRLNRTWAVGLATLVVGAGFWYVPVTHSTENVDQFTSNASAHGLQLLPSRQPGQSIFDAYLFGNSTTVASAARYESDVAGYYRDHRPFVTIAPDAAQPSWGLQSTSVPAPSVRSTLAQRVLHDVDLGIQQLSNLLIGLGVMVLLFSRRARARLRGPAGALVCLAFGSLVLLSATRLSGAIAHFYNQERLFVQVMVVLGVVLALVVDAVPRRARLSSAAAAVFVVAIGVSFAHNIGAQAVVAGGAPTPNVASVSEEGDRFELSAAESASAVWFAEQAPSTAFVYADRYGVLRLQAFTDLDVRRVYQDVTPQTLDQHAWIYGSEANTVAGRARGVVGGRQTLYTWPTAFLDSHYATVYTDGASSVWTR